MCCVLQVHRSIPLPAAPAAEVADYQAVPAPSSTAAPKQLVFADQVSSQTLAFLHCVSQAWFGNNFADSMERRHALFNSRPAYQGQPLL
jgi:hypothetical protein